MVLCPCHSVDHLELVHLRTSQGIHCSSCAFIPLFFYLGYFVCVYLMIGKGQIAQKRPYWGENRLKSKIMGKSKYLVVL